MSGKINERRIILRRKSAWLSAVWWWLFLPIWTWWTRTFEVTDRRIVIRRGILSKQEHSVRLENIQDVALRRGFVGRMLGYGDIAVETSGTAGTEFVFRHLAQADKVQAAIYEAQEQRRREDQARQAAGFLASTGRNQTVV